MFKCKIAEIVVEIDNRFPYTENACRDYFCADTEKSDIIIKVSDAEIESERRENLKISPELLEFTAIYRKLCEAMSRYDGFIMHSSLISIDGDGIAFLAPSGTGKTTHTANWKKAFGERVQIVNGDKPIVRIIGEEIMAYGTPWCGKEKINRNTHTHLKALAFIKRDEKNHVESISSEAALPLLMQQLLIPKEDDEVIKLLDYVNILLSKCKLYAIYCTAEEESAIVAYNAIKNG